MKLATSSPVPAFCLGLLTILGGVAGYVKKGSISSLAAGLILGFLLVISGVLMKKKQYEGNMLALLTSGIMVYAMTGRYLQSRKMMPSGIVAALGTLSLAYHLKKTLESKSTTTAEGTKISSLRWWQGFFISSIFSVVYLLTPAYLISALLAIFVQFPSKEIAFLYTSPLLLSILFPSKQMLFLANYMEAMLDYFDYEEVTEISNEELLNNTSSGKNYILALQPHGVISFCSLCSWVKAPAEVRKVKTGVASVLLKFPILKHVMGIYGLTPASSGNIRKILQRERGIDGSLVLYIGGIAELFKSSRKEERLYLKKRKGFIKIALREGADVIPIYLFGNTSVLTVVKTGLLASLSRKLQMSLTYFWGQFLLPVPRSEKLLYVRGKPLGLPHLPEPTEEDIDKWHAKYCEEVTRIFESYKEKVPAYKHKTLHMD